MESALTCMNEYQNVTTLFSYISLAFSSKAYKWEVLPIYIYKSLEIYMYIYIYVHTCVSNLTQSWRTFLRLVFYSPNCVNIFPTQGGVLPHFPSPSENHVSAFGSNIDKRSSESRTQKHGHIHLGNCSCRSAGVQNFTRKILRFQPLNHSPN